MLFPRYVFFITVVSPLVFSPPVFKTWKSTDGETPKAAFRRSPQSFLDYFENIFL